MPFLLQHGYTVLFVWVFAEHMGFPVPSIPALLAVGALAGAGELSFALALALALAAALVGDVIWYAIGRRRGGSVLNFLCRIALEPDSCVSNTKSAFARYGAKSLLVAKFIPGLSTAARPLAGIFRMRFSRFLLYDVAGAILWAGAYLGVGAIVSDELERAADLARRTGSSLLIALGAFLGGFVAFKYWQRHKFLRELRVARISPDELKQKLDRGEEILIVDLRSDLDFEADPATLPGALRWSARELESDHQQLLWGREVVLYCT